MTPPQGSLEWKLWRRSMVGASDISAIMGESSFKNVEQLWQEKKGLRDVFETEAMRLGKELEPMIRRLFEDYIGVFISDVPEPLIHPLYPNFMASLDGMSHDGLIGCELKSANPHDHKLAIEGRVPEKYYGQVQWQMGVTGLNEWYYVSYGKVCKTLAVVKVSRDDKYICKAIFKAVDFLGMLKLDKFPLKVEPAVPLELYEKIARLKQVDQAFEYASEQKELARKDILEYLDGKEIDCLGVKINKISRKGSPNYAIIPELQGINLDLYRKPDSVHFTISIKEHDDASPV